MPVPMAALLHRPGDQSWQNLLRVFGGKRNLDYSKGMDGQSHITFKVVGLDGSLTEVKIVRTNTELTISNRRNGRTGDVVKADLKDR